MLRSRAPVALLLALVGCGAAAAGPARSRSADPSGLDTSGWSAPVPPAAASNPAPPDVAGLALADGERLRSVLAVSEVGSSPAECALYGLRSVGGVIEEGRATMPCAEVPSLDGEPFAVLALADVDTGRARSLRAALDGAVLADAAGPELGAVSVRVSTDRRTLQGAVRHPSWPPPAGIPDPLVRSDPPASLDDLWDALMFPERWMGR